MTANTTLPVLLGTGIHSARPAADDVGSGGLYSCTTHSLVYQTDGSSWTTWATLGGSSDLDAIISASAGQDIADALSGAAAPDAGNVFATMADVGSGGGLVLLEEHAANNTSVNLDFTAFISGTYDDYLIEFNNLIPATNNITIGIRAGTGGGPTYDTGGNYDSLAQYVYNGGAGTAGSSGTNTTSYQVSDSVGNNTNYGMSGHLRLYAPGSTTQYKSWVGDIVLQHASVGMFLIRGSGIYKSATALTAMRIFSSSGNLLSGDVRVYGIAK